MMCFLNDENQVSHNLLFYGRLERMLETAMMIMESFAGFESKFEYGIMGHSGDSAEISFVEFGLPPLDRKERLNVLIS
jgi:hypothetical protein